MLSLQDSRVQHILVARGYPPRFPPVRGVCTWSKETVPAATQPAPFPEPPPPSLSLLPLSLPSHSILKVNSPSEVESTILKTQLPSPFRVFPFAFTITADFLLSCPPRESAVLLLSLSQGFCVWPPLCLWGSSPLYVCPYVWVLQSDSLREQPEWVC